LNTASIRYLGDLRTESTHLQSGDTILTDPPVDNHGRGEAFSPTDLLASSFVSCMITIMGIHAQKRGLDLGAVSGTVLKVMAESPRRVARLEVEITFEGNTLDVETRRQIEQAGLNCPVAKSLHPDIDQDVRFSYR
jgi:putative redox protein